MALTARLRLGEHWRTLAQTSEPPPDRDGVGLESVAARDRDLTGWLSRRYGRLPRLADERRRGAARANHGAAAADDG